MQIFLSFDTSSRGGERGGGPYILFPENNFVFILKNVQTISKVRANMPPPVYSATWDLGLIRVKGTLYILETT